MKTTINIIGPYAGLPNVNGMMHLQHQDKVKRIDIKPVNLYVVDSTQNTLVVLPGTIVNTGQIQDLIDSGCTVNIKNLRSKDDSGLYVTYEIWKELT